MPKKILALISLLLVAATLVGCGSKSQRRKEKIYELLEEDKVSYDYTEIDGGGSYKSTLFGDGMVMVDYKYLFSTGNAIYSLNYVGDSGIHYEVHRHDIVNGGKEVVRTIPLTSDEFFFPVFMIDDTCYYKYKIEEVYNSIGSSITQSPDSYVYHWYKFNFDGEYQSLGISYPSDEEMNPEEYDAMVRDFETQMILSKIGVGKAEELLTSPGIMAELSAMANTTAHDKFTLQRVCGYNPANGSILFHCYYHVNEGNNPLSSDMKYGLDLCFLRTADGETHYVGDYKYKTFYGDDMPYLIPLE